MRIVVKPSVMDGTITLQDIELGDNLSACNIYGNRIRIIKEKSSESIVPYLLKFKAKGTEFDFDNQNFFYILAVCSAFSSSKTTFKKFDKDNIQNFSEMMMAVGIDNFIQDNKFIVDGKCGIKGGVVDCKCDKALLPFILAGSHSELGITINDCNINESIIDKLKALGLDISVE